MRGPITLLLLAAAAACAPPTAPATIRAEPGAVFTLAVGQEAAVGDSLRIRFVGVAADSRCPIDVQCVWAGDAQLRLLIRQRSGAERQVELHTALDPRATSAGGYTLSVQGLLPEPRANRPTDPAQYRLDVLLTRG